MTPIKQFVLLFLLVVASGCVGHPDLDSPASDELAHIVFSCGKVSGHTRSTGSITQAVGDDTPRINDLNIWLLRDGACIHAYIANTTWASLLPKGSYNLYIIGNAGEDLGVKSVDELSALRTTDLGCDERNTLLLSAKQRIEILHDATFDLELQRIVARITVNINVAPAFQQQFKLKSYQICNIPQYAYLFEQEGALLPPAEVCNQTSEVVKSSNNTSISDIVYLYENIKPENTEITSSTEKNPTTAPVGATYVHIIGISQYNDQATQYYCYLGENDTSNFNIRRNTSKEYTITITGQNTADVRLNVTQVLADDEGSTYCDLQTYPSSNSSAVFDMGTFSVNNTTSTEYLKDRCWIVFPAGDQYTFDDGKTWTTAVANTPVLLTDENNYTFSVQRFASSVSAPHTENTPPFTLYYGLEGNRVPITPDFDYTRTFLYATIFNVVGIDDDDDFNLTQFSTTYGQVGGWPVVASIHPLRIYPTMTAGEFYFSFTWPATYKLLGFRDKFGTWFNPTDMPNDITSTSWTSGSMTTFVYWQENNRGSGTIDIVFEKKTFSQQQSLYVPNNAGYAVTISSDSSFTKSTDGDYDVYTMQAGAKITAALSATGGPYGNTDQDFNAWTTTLINSQTSSEIGYTSTSVSFTMAESCYLRPTWKPCSRLDAEGSYANCYMIHSTNTFYAFSALYGGKISHQLPKPSKVQIVWTDALDNGSTNISDAIEVNYEASSGLVYIRWKGNAELPSGSVLLKSVDAAGATLWTWHIWFTTYYPTADSFGLMTRNLGALADADNRTAEVGYPEDYTPRSGYLYQPGRQVPFHLYASTYGIVNSLSPAADKLALSGHGIVTNWGTVKGTHDPCPYGWRVADYSELTKAGISNSTASKDQQSFYNGTFCLPAFGVMWAYLPFGGSAYSQKVSLTGRGEETYSDVTFATAYATATGSYLCPYYSKGTNIATDLSLSYGDRNNNVITPLAGMVRCIKE